VRMRHEQPGGRVFERTVVKVLPNRR